MTNENIFRQATSVRTWPEGDVETYHWIEVKPDAWLGVNRLAESIQEAQEIKNSSGHGDKKTGSFEMLCTTRHIRATSDSVEFFDAPSRRKS